MLRLNQVQELSSSLSINHERRAVARRRVTLFVHGLACVMLAACAQTTPPPPPAVTVATETYVIGPGDHIGVFVYANPQISISDIPVRPDGRISLPLIQDLVAAGKTPSELSSDVSAHLSKYVKEPNVTIYVRDFVGPFDRQIRVIGEAAEPQAISYRAHMTLLDVMIQTKGLTRFAAGNQAVIVRRMPGGKQQSFSAHLSDLIRSGDISQNVEMQPGDTLIIPQTWY